MAIRAPMRLHNVLLAAALLAAALLMPATEAAFAQHAALPVSDKVITAGALKIERIWTRATPPGAKVAGGFMRITNTGKEPDRLVGGEFAIAGIFEVHEMKVENGVMSMRALEKGLEIAPGQSVELKPGGYHVMFMDLKQPVAPGSAISGTLTFEKAGKVTVTFEAAGIGAPGPADQHKH